MSKRTAKPAYPFPEPQMRPACSECGRGTPYLFKGIRYCAEHHPDPGQHIRVRAKAEAA